MKIVFIGGRNIKDIGGIENYMYNLATQLVRKGHEPIVFCESDHNGEDWLNGFRVVYMKGPKSNLICKPYVGLKATLFTIFRIENVDIIHYNAWPPSIWCPLARCFGLKSLMQGHGFGWQRTKYSPRQKKIMKFMEKIAAKINQYLIMCSENQTRYFKENYHRDAVTIPTAINLPDETKILTDSVLKKFCIVPKRYFLYMARLINDKNPDSLIKAFKQANLEGYQLVIAGNNTSAPKYVEFLHSLAKDNRNIVFTDAVFGEDKEVLFKNAFVYCIPSTIEGLSISLLEAMSYRLPIIASSIPANREVLPDDRALWVTPENVDELADAIKDSVRKKDWFLKTTIPNYELVRDNYTWDKVSDIYISYLETITK